MGKMEDLLNELIEALRSTLAKISLKKPSQVIEIKGDRLHPGFGRNKC